MHREIRNICVSYPDHINVVVGFNADLEAIFSFLKSAEVTHDTTQHTYHHTTVLDKDTKH